MSSSPSSSPIFPSPFPVPQVFFTSECVMGCRRPQVGSMVHVAAERPHPHACWRATRVEVTERWESERREEKKVSQSVIQRHVLGHILSKSFEVTCASVVVTSRCQFFPLSSSLTPSSHSSSLQTLIGFISKLSNTLAIVDCGTEEVTFDPQAVVAMGYKPQASDWVSISVRRYCEGGEEGEEEEEAEEEEVVEVKPLREKEVEGEVTSFGQGKPNSCIGCSPYTL